jgi:hypothetical protein
VYLGMCVEVWCFLGAGHRSGNKKRTFIDNNETTGSYCRTLPELLDAPPYFTPVLHQESMIEDIFNESFPIKTLIIE